MVNQIKAVSNQKDTELPFYIISPEIENTFKQNIKENKIDQVGIDLLNSIIAINTLTIDHFDDDKYFKKIQNQIEHLDNFVNNGSDDEKNILNKINSLIEQKQKYQQIGTGVEVTLRAKIKNQTDEYDAKKKKIESDFEEKTNKIDVDMKETDKKINVANTDIYNIVVKMHEDVVTKLGKIEQKQLQNNNNFLQQKINENKTALEDREKQLNIEKKNEQNKNEEKLKQKFEDIKKIISLKLNNSKDKSSKLSIQDVKGLKYTGSLQHYKWIQKDLKLSDEIQVATHITRNTANKDENKEVQKYDPNFRIKNIMRLLISIEKAEFKEFLADVDFDKRQKAIDALHEYVNLLPVDYLFTLDKSTKPQSFYRFLAVANANELNKLPETDFNKILSPDLKQKWRELLKILLYYNYNANEVDIQERFYLL